MLSHEVKLGCLFVWTGISLGFVLLALSDVLRISDLAWWSFAVLCVSCTYSVHRSMAARDERLRQAFEMGRAHERDRTEIHSLR